MAMFTAIRRGKPKPGMAGEFAKRVQAGALPAMRKMDGFMAYYLIAAGDDTVIAVSYNMIRPHSSLGYRPPGPQTAQRQLESGKPLCLHCVA